MLFEIIIKYYFAFYQHDEFICDYSSFEVEQNK